MNNTQIFNTRRFGKIRVSGQHEQYLFCLTDICKALDIKNPTDVKSRLKDGFIIGTTIDEAGKRHKVNFVNGDTLLKIIAKSGTASYDHKQKLLKWLISKKLVSNSIILCSRLETELGNLIEDVLSRVCQVIRQYPVDQYKIDFFIPAFNLAIEYDEKHHYTKDNKSKELKYYSRNTMI